MNEPRDSIEAMARAGAAAVAEHTEETSNLRVDLARVTEELAAAKDNASLLRAEVARLRAVVRKLSARPEVSRG